jgi:hypothetical protein
MCRSAEMARSEVHRDVFFSGVDQRGSVAEMRWEWPI